MHLLSRIFGRAPEAKDSRAGALLALHSLGFARWTTRSAVTLTQAGYERNAVVFRAVRMIAEAGASIPWLVFEGRQENPEHPLADLIAQPNAGCSGIDFFEALFSNLLLFGNAYIEAVTIDGAPREFHSLRPDRMSVVPGRSGWPAAYDYSVAGQKVRYDMEVDGVAPILHLKCFHPLDDYYGFAPIAAAQVALDTHNAAGFRNKALLDNAARPSGALVYTGADGGHLTELQFERLKSELEENFSGALNAGRPLLLEGGLDWKALSLSPKDMDFIEAKAAAAREIALAFGVPPLVLGLPGDNTFANYAEANKAFWRQTVIPLVARTQKQFAAWLKSGFEPFRFDYDVDRIDALAADRESEWRRIDAASFLTQDEKREAAGYGALPRGTQAAPAQDNTGPSS
jgi:HK97 family phage portal protein